MNNFYQIAESTKSKIIDLIDHNKLSIVDGDILEEFESKFASFFGHKYGVATCNGTSAIHLSYFALGISNGDEVLMPTYGFHAMASPLLQVGGTPIFCDIDLDSLTIDVNDMRKKITQKTKAIMVLQPWGNLANIDEIILFAKANKLYVISDSSHATGAKWLKKPLGSFVDIVCASLGKGKLISGGELGVFTTNNKEFRDRALLFSHTNRVPKAYLTEKYKEISNIIGIKYRPHPFAIRLALDQIESFKVRNSDLLKNIFLLIKVISEIKSISLQKSFSNSFRNYWKIVLICDSKTIEKLTSLAVKYNLAFENNHYSTLLHEDSICTQYFRIFQTGFPVAESIKERIVQIDAIQLFDINVLKKYIELFSEFKSGNYE